MFSEKKVLHEKLKAYRPGNLRTIALDTTTRCNMACAHCYAETFANKKQVALDVMSRTFEELRELGVFHYVLQGGEPITDPERLEGILTAIFPDETYINLVSNGYEMTRDTIRWLKSLKVDKIAFSLDSGILAEHDINRLPGSFARTLRAIDDVLAEGLLSSVSIVVTRFSLYSDGFKKAYELAKSKGIRLDVQIAEPVGKWDGRLDLLMRPEDTRYIKTLRIESPTLANGQVMVNRDVYSGNQDHCPAGKEFMAITADGNVLPCNFLQFTLGNISDDTFSSMRNRLIANKWFQCRPLCLCGEDQEFIQEIMVPTIGRPKPLNANDVFDLKPQG